MLDPGKAPTTLRAPLIGQGGGKARPVRRKVDVRDWISYRHCGARARRRNGLSRPGPRRAGRSCGRDLLQHRNERLPGNSDRSVLRRADHHLHLSPYRQCRNQRGRPGGRHAGGARARAPRRRHRAIQLARPAAPRTLARAAWPHRHRRRRYQAPDPPLAHGRRTGRRARSHVRAGGDRRCSAHRQGPRLAGTGGHGPRQGGQLPSGLRLD